MVLREMTTSFYVYNWGEYIDESVIDDFEKETGIQVVYDVFETNEEMYPVIEAGGVSYDGMSLRLYDPEDDRKQPSG